MFKDPIKDKPKKNDGLPYDERSSVFVNVGTYHGVGHDNPIGTMDKKSADVIPMKSKVFKVSEYDQK